MHERSAPVDTVNSAIKVIDTDSVEDRNGKPADVLGSGTVDPQLPSAAAGCVSRYLAWRDKAATKSEPPALDQVWG